jgi:hypothetical protein
MEQFKEVWSSVNRYGAVQTGLEQFKQVWSSLNRYGAV